MHQQLTLYRNTIYVKTVKAYHQPNTSENRASPGSSALRPPEAMLRIRHASNPSRSFLGTSELLEPKNKFRSHAFQLLGVGRGKSFKHILAATGELDEHLPTVLG